jgi:hypothetical protein
VNFEQGFILIRTNNLLGSGQNEKEGPLIEILLRMPG